MRAFFQSWKLAASLAGYRQQLLITVATLAVSLTGYRFFLEFIENRPGVVFADPFLVLFPPLNLTLITFVLIYGGLILAIVVLGQYPWRLLHAMQAYVVLIVLRIAYMYFLPLDPPSTFIPLKDPFVEYFGSGVVLTRDLFFSGHTATMVLLGFVMPWRDMRIGFYAGAGVIALCVLVQHVHYTIDVIVAPCVAYAAYGLAGLYVVKEPPMASANRNSDINGGKR